LKQNDSLFIDGSGRLQYCEMRFS